MATIRRPVDYTQRQKGLATQFQSLLKAQTTASTSAGVGTSTTSTGTARTAARLALAALQQMSKKNYGDDQVNKVRLKMRSMTHDEKLALLAFICKWYKLFQPTSGFTGPLKDAQEAAYKELEEYKKKFNMTDRNGKVVFQWNTVTRAAEGELELLEICEEFRKVKPEFGYPSSSLALHGLTEEQAISYVFRRNLLAQIFLVNPRENTNDVPSKFAGRDLAKLTENEFGELATSASAFYTGYIMPVTAIADLKEIRMLPQKEKQYTVNTMKVATYNYLCGELRLDPKKYPKNNSGLRAALIQARQDLYVQKKAFGTTSTVFVADDEWADIKEGYIKWTENEPSYSAGEEERGKEIDKTG
jgi:hypothetical protein